MGSTMNTKRRELSLSELDDRGNVAGELNENGNATPDEELVDEIGEAIGVTYRDDEELRVGRKEAERDEHRWELDPASSEDWLQRSHDLSGGPAEEVQHLTHRHRERRME